MVNSKSIHIRNYTYSSPNFEVRAPSVPLDLIVIHSTQMPSDKDALNRLCDTESKVSAHFLISRPGELYELVDPVYRAWHAGVSFWQGERDINSRSIGIELDNPGNNVKWAEFPPVQIQALLSLLKDLTITYNIPRHRIVGHSDVAPLRKDDPGELFPWEELAKAGFGLWPARTDNIMVTPSNLWTVVEVQKALADIGYECPQTGTWDDVSQSVCLAFQRHFTPRELTGCFSALTCQWLKEIVYETAQKEISV